MLGLSPPLALTADTPPAAHTIQVETHQLLGNLRHDLASEVFRTLNAALPKSGWIFSHVSDVADAASYPGATVDLKPQPVAAAIKEISHALQLPIAIHGHFAWVHQKLNQQALDEAIQAIQKDDQVEQQKAFDQLIKMDHPQALTALVQHWSQQPQEHFLQNSARTAVAISMGVQRSEMNGRQLIFALWGHPDTEQSRVHPLFDFTTRPVHNAPWAAITVILANQAAQKALVQLLTTHPHLEKDAVALTLGLCLALREETSAALNDQLAQALGVWCVKPPVNAARWEHGFMRSRAQTVHALLFPNRAVPKPAEKKKKKTQRKPVEALSNEELRARIRQMNFEAKLGYRMATSQQRIQQAALALEQSDAQDEAQQKELKKALRAAQAQPEQLARELKSSLRAVRLLTNFSANAENITLFQELLNSRPENVAEDRVVHQDIRQAITALAIDWRAPELETTLIDAALNDPQPVVQQAAALSLGAQRSHQAVTALHQQLQQTGSVEKRLNAARGLTQARPEQAATWLKTQLKISTSTAEHTALMQFLGLLRQDAATDFLIATATDPAQTANLRLAAAIGLRSVPTKQAQETLQNLLMHDPNANIRRLILEGLTPTTLSEAYRVLPLMLEVIGHEEEPSLQQVIVQNIQLAARLMPAGHPQRLAAAEALVSVIGNTKLNSNIRRFAASGIKYVDVNEDIVNQLNNVVQSTRHPILKRFFSTAHKQAAARLSPATE
jgi:hypothetical protein